MKSEVLHGTGVKPSEYSFNLFLMKAAADGNQFRCSRSSIFSKAINTYSISPFSSNE